MQLPVLDWSLDDAIGGGGIGAGADDWRKWKWAMEAIEAIEAIEALSVGGRSNSSLAVVYWPSRERQWNNNTTWTTINEAKGWKEAGCLQQAPSTVYIVYSYRTCAGSTGGVSPDVMGRVMSASPGLFWDMQPCVCVCVCVCVMKQQSSFVFFFSSVPLRRRRHGHM